MACIITYNNKKYTQPEFNEYFKTHFFEFAGDFLGSQADIEGFKEFVQGKQFQKLTEEEKAKTIEQVTKEHRSITALKDLAAKLAHRIGGKVKFENRTDVDWKGYNQGMTSVLNEAYMTPDTPFHEILAHPIIRGLKYSKNIGGTINLDGTLDKSTAKVEFSKIYQNLLKELETGRGKEIFEQVKRDYAFKLKIPNKYQTDSLDYYINGTKYYKYYPIDGEEVEITKHEYEKNIPENIKYTLEEQQEEAIITLLGELAAGKLEEKENASLKKKLLEFWKQISDFVRQLLLQDEIRIDELPITTTLNDLAEIMAYGNNKIILPGYKIEYQTPLGNKYETLEEVNNEIRGLADADVEVDLSGVKVEKESYWVEWSEERIVYDRPEDPYDVSYYNRDFLTKKGAEEFVQTLEEKGVYNATITQKKHESFESKTFIEKNKEYEQSKEIIEQWKKENNIQYDPEEVYSRGQGFYSSIGAYSNLELDLLLKNLIQHIEDNKKAGGEFTISAFTRPIDKRLKHIEGTGDRVRFVIYPKSEHIKWAALTDVHSGSVWDASKKISKDKKSELLGVSFTKAPALRNINEVSPNLADIIDNLSHVHNELGIELTTDNFRIEYDDNIDYSTKKLIDNINKILDDKYGKLVKPEISAKEVGQKYEVYDSYENKVIKSFSTEKEAINYMQNELPYEEYRYSVGSKKKIIGKQPTQTRENTTSIENVKNEIANDLGNGNFKAIKDQGFWRIVQILDNGVEVGISKEEDYYEPFIFDTKEQAENYINKGKGKEYTSQAEINLKVAALKEVARKYPRSLITSKVVPINPNLEDNSEIQYSKVGSKQDIEGFKQFVQQRETKKQTIKASDSVVPTKTQYVYDYVFSKLFENFKPYVKEVTTDRNRADEILKEVEAKFDSNDLVNHQIDNFISFDMNQSWNIDTNPENIISSLKLKYPNLRFKIIKEFDRESGDIVLKAKINNLFYNKSFREKEAAFELDIFKYSDIEHIMYDEGLKNAIKLYYKPIRAEKNSLYILNDKIIYKENDNYYSISKKGTIYENLKFGYFVIEEKYQRNKVYQLFNNNLTFYMEDSSSKNSLRKEIIDYFEILKSLRSRNENTFYSLSKKHLVSKISALQSIKKNSKETYYSLLADNLIKSLPLLKNKNITIKKIKFDSHAFYSSDTDSIVLDYNTTSVNILLHEFMHNAISIDDDSKLNDRDKEFVHKIKSLYAQAIGEEYDENDILDNEEDRLGKDGNYYYGLSNINEFIAEAFTDIKFQTYLYSLKTDKDSNIFTELYIALVNFIKSFLNEETTTKSNILAETIDTVMEYLENRDFNDDNIDLSWDSHKVRIIKKDPEMNIDVWLNLTNREKIQILNCI